MNEKIFLFINSFAKQSLILDNFMIFSAKSMPYIFILIEIYLYFIMKKKKESIFAFYSMLISLSINQIISLFYFHNRPFMDNIGTLLITHIPENSFPSDHTTFLFAISFSLIFSKIKYSNILLIFAFLGSIARIYVGVHYPYDILGGIFSGFLGAIVIYLYKDKLSKFNKIIYKIEFLIFKGKI